MHYSLQPHPERQGRWAWPTVRHLAGWLVVMVVLPSLLALRAQVGGEFAMATLALLPVMWIAWDQGHAAGLLTAVLAAGTCLLGDLEVEHDLATAWVPWFNGLARSLAFGLVAWLTAGLRASLRREREQSLRDPLTGLYNRSHFMEAGAVEADRSNRYDHPVAVLCLGLEPLRQVAQARDQDAADAVLREVARALRQEARGTDLVARIGDDEFAVLLSEVTLEATQHAARRLADSLRQAAAELPDLSVSVGGAWYGRHTPPVSTMMSLAEAARHRSRALGTAQIVDGAASDGRKP